MKLVSRKFEQLARRNENNSDQSFLQNDTLKVKSSSIGPVRMIYEPQHLG